MNTHRQPTEADPIEDDEEQEEQNPTDDECYGAESAQGCPEEIVYEYDVEPGVEGDFDVQCPAAEQLVVDLAMDEPTYSVMHTYDDPEAELNPLLDGRPLLSHEHSEPLTHDPFNPPLDIPASTFGHLDVDLDTSLSAFSLPASPLDPLPPDDPLFGTGPLGY